MGIPKVRGISKGRNLNPLCGGRVLHLRRRGTEAGAGDGGWGLGVGGSGFGVERRGLVGKGSVPQGWDIFDVYKIELHSHEPRTPNIVDAYKIELHCRFVENAGDTVMVRVVALWVMQRV